MSGRGRHRRQSQRRISRRISRASLAITAGSAGLALPFIGSGTAHAASVDTSKVTQAKAADSDAAKKAEKSEKKDRPKSGEKYTVKPGDTLASIAREHDTEGGWQALYKANRKTVGSDPDLIRPGQKLSLDGQERASRSQPQRSAAPQAGTVHKSGSKYGNNLDGWIREALDIMKSKNIPGTYDGIKRNIMRESGGNPNAVNNWDVNAQNGTPSKGLLQTIQPTFDSYHVEGTANSMTDPVANIVAACNYAAAKYGSIDNVNGPY